MRKLSSFLIALVLTVLCMTLFVSAADITVQLNGNTLSFEQAPVIVEGRTLVPLRAIFEALGASVEWDNDTKTVTSVKDGTTVKMTIGSDVFYVNAEAIELDVPAQIVGEGYTMVPARAIAESFGVLVNWDDDTKTVMLTVSDSDKVTMFARDGRTKQVLKTNMLTEKADGWMDISEFEQYLQPWADAYVQVAFTGEYGGNPQGEYILAVDENKSFEALEAKPAFETTGEYNYSFTQMREKYGKQNLLGYPVSYIGKTSYKSIDEVYNYLSQWFSTDLFPHTGTYNMYEYQNSLYCQTYLDKTSTNELNKSIHSIYLGCYDNHHYIGVFNGLNYTNLDILELTTVDNKLIITECYCIYSTSQLTNALPIDIRTKNPMLVFDLLKQYFENPDLNFMNLSRTQLKTLSYYFIESQYHINRPVTTFKSKDGTSEAGKSHLMLPNDEIVISQNSADADIYTIQVKNTFAGFNTHFQISFSISDGELNLLNLNSYVEGSLD